MKNDHVALVYAASLVTVVVEIIMSSSTYRFGDDHISRSWQHQTL